MLDALIECLQRIHKLVAPLLERLVRAVWAVRHALVCLIQHLRAVVQCQDTATTSTAVH